MSPDPRSTRILLAAAKAQSSRMVGKAVGDTTLESEGNADKIESKI